MPSPSAEERSDRILAEKLRLLYRGNFAVPVNLAVACVVAFLLRNSFPQPLLIAWLAATALVAGLRILLHRRFLRAAARRAAAHDGRAISASGHSHRGWFGERSLSAFPSGAVQTNTSS